MSISFLNERNSRASTFFAKGTIDKERRSNPSFEAFMR